MICSLKHTLLASLVVHCVMLTFNVDGFLFNEHIGEQVLLRKRRGFLFSHINMTPNDPHGFVGELLTLNCTLSEESLKQNPGCNASDIYFEFNNTRITSGVTVLSEAVAQLNIRPDIKHEKLYHCSVDNSSNSACTNLMNLADSFPGAQSVKVGVKPQPINLHPCVVNNWENMNCTWGPVQSEEHLIHRTKTTVLWHSSDGKNGTVEAAENLNHIYWSMDGGNFSVDLTYNLTVRVAVSYNTVNDAGTTQNLAGIFHEEESMVIDPMDYVKQSRLAYVHAEKKSARTVTLKWELAPSRSKSPEVQKLLQSGSFKYNLTEIRQGVVPSWFEFVEKAVHLTHYIDHLVPFTKYDILLSVRPDGLSTSYYSEPYKLTITTDEDTPGEDPKLYEGGFSVRPVGENKENVTIYWTEVPENKRYGNVSTMHHKVYFVDQDEPCESDMRQQKFELQGGNTNQWSALIPQPHHSYKVFVTACSATEGCNSPAPECRSSGQHADVITIPAKELRPKTPNIVVKADSKQRKLIVEWKYPRDTYKAFVFWCHGRQKCERHLNSSGLLKDKQVYTITVAPDTSPVDDYQVGVSVGSKYGFSGIQWLNQKCIYDVHAAPSPPVHVKVNSSMAHGTIQVKWEKQPCATGRGFTQYFLVWYCTVKAKDEDCSQKAENKTVAGNDRKEFSTVLDNLHQRQQYRVWVVAVGDDDRSSPATQPEYAYSTGSWWTMGRTAAIAITIIIVALIALVGFYYVIRKCKVQTKKLTTVPFLLPKEPDGLDFPSPPGSACPLLGQGTSNYSISTPTDSGIFTEHGTGDSNVFFGGTTCAHCPTCGSSRINKLPSVTEEYEDTVDSGNSVMNPHYILTGAAGAADVEGACGEQPVAVAAGDYPTPESGRASQQRICNYASIAYADDHDMEDDVFISGKNKDPVSVEFHKNRPAPPSGSTMNPYLTETQVMQGNIPQNKNLGVTTSQTPYLFPSENVTKTPAETNKVAKLNSPQLHHTPQVPTGYVSEVGVGSNSPQQNRPEQRNTSPEQTNIGAGSYVGLDETGCIVEVLPAKDGKQQLRSTEEKKTSPKKQQEIENSPGINQKQPSKACSGYVDESCLPVDKKQPDSRAYGGYVDKTCVPVYKKQPGRAYSGYVDESCVPIDKKPPGRAYSGYVDETCVPVDKKQPGSAYSGYVNEKCVPVDKKQPGRACGGYVDESCVPVDKKQSGMAYGGYVDHNCMPVARHSKADKEKVGMEAHESSPSGKALEAESPEQKSRVAPSVQQDGYLPHCAVENGHINTDNVENIKDSISQPFVETNKDDPHERLKNPEQFSTVNGYVPHGEVEGAGKPLLTVNGYVPHSQLEDDNEQSSTLNSHVPQATVGGDEEWSSTVNGYVPQHQMEEDGKVSSRVGSEPDNGELPGSTGLASQAVHKVSSGYVPNDSLTTQPAANGYIQHDQVDANDLAADGNCVGQASGYISRDDIETMAEKSDRSESVSSTKALLSPRRHSDSSEDSGICSPPVKLRQPSFPGRSTKDEQSKPYVLPTAIESSA